jgi:hypothetical protein
MIFKHSKDRKWINAPKHMKNLDIKKYVIYMPPNARLDKEKLYTFQTSMMQKNLGSDYMLENNGNEGWQVVNGI